MRSLSLPLIAVLAACGPQPMVVPPEVKDPVVSAIAGGLEAGTAAAQSPVSMSATPVALSSASGCLRRMYV